MISFYGEFDMLNKKKNGKWSDKTLCLPFLNDRYRIGPFEVESALIEHPAVLESAVVSSPDPVRGEVILTVIVHIGMTYIYIYTINSGW